MGVSITHVHVLCGTACGKDVVAKVGDRDFGRKDPSYPRLWASEIWGGIVVDSWRKRASMTNEQRLRDEQSQY